MIEGLHVLGWGQYLLVSSRLFRHLLLLGSPLGLVGGLGTGAGHKVRKDLGLLEQVVEALAAVRRDLVLELGLALGRLFALGPGLGILGGGFTHFNTRNGFPPKTVFVWVLCLPTAAVTLFGYGRLAHRRNFSMAIIGPLTEFSLVSCISTCSASSLIAIPGIFQAAITIFTI